MPGITLRQLKWTSIVVPIAFVAGVETLTADILEPRFGHVTTHAAEISLVAVGAIAFATVMFRILDRAQRDIVRQNRELLALNAVGRAVTTAPDLHEALTLALHEVIGITGAAAGDVVIDARDAAVAPVRITCGDAGDAACLPEPPAGSGDPSGGVSFDVRFVSSGGGGDAPARTGALIPLVTQGRTLGVMRLVGDPSSHLAPGRSEPLLRAIGHQLAVAVQAGHLFDDVAQRGREAQALYEVGLKIASMQDPARILDVVVGRAREILDVDAAVLCLRPSDRAGMAVAAFSGPREALRRDPPDGAVAYVEWFGAGHQPCPDDGGAPCGALAPEYRAFATNATLRLGESSAGELTVASRAPRTFTEHDRVLLHGLADMAAIAVNNGRLLASERYVAVLEERERISRELHDGSAQALGYLHLKSHAIRAELGAASTDALAAELEQMASVAEDAYQDVREAILGLRETISSDEGLAGSLREYVQKFSRQSGIDARFEVQASDLPQLTPDVEVQLVRVIQEALANVRKHAKSQSAHVVLDRLGSDTVIVVSDDGQGFEPRRIESVDGGFGIRTMRERMERVGGQLEIDSAPGCGTRVQIRLRDRVNGELHDANPRAARR